MSAKVLLIGSCFLMSLGGCGGSVTSQGPVQFRVISATTNPANLDVFTDTDLLASNVSVSGFTNYFNQTASLKTIGVRPNGSTQTIAATNVIPNSGEKYTILPYQQTLNSISLAILLDNTVAPSAQKIKARFMHVSRLKGPVDVYFVAPLADLSSQTPIFTSIAFGSASQHIELPASATAKEMVVTEAGTINPVGNSISFTPTAGLVRTFLFIENNGPKLHFYVD